MGAVFPELSIKAPEALTGVFGTILGFYFGRGGGAERRRLHDDARHQVIHVAHRAGIDGPAEDVAEEQHEHDGLQEHREELVHVLEDMLQAAHDEDPRVAEEPEGRGMGGCVHLAGGNGSGLLLLFLGRAPREPQEDVVERGLSQID